MEGEWAINRPTLSSPMRLLDHSPTSPYIKMNFDGDMELQEVINGWKGSTRVTALISAPEILLISLACFQFSGNRVRKKRNRIQLQRRVVMPVFDARTARRSLTATAGGPRARPKQARATHDAHYSLIGGIIHIGDLAHTGHYRAFEIAPKTGMPDGTEDAISAADITIHDDNRRPAVATRAQLNQIHNNAYVIALRKS